MVKITMAGDHKQSSESLSGELVENSIESLDAGGRWSNLPWIQQDPPADCPGLQPDGEARSFLPRSLGGRLDCVAITIPDCSSVIDVLSCCIVGATLTSASAPGTEE